MKTRRIVASIAAASAVIALAGCPLIPGLAPTTPTPPTFPAGAKLIGRFTFGGSAPSATGLKAKYREAGKSVADAAQKADVDSQGYFYFDDSTITSGNNYQMVWDDGGKLVTDKTINTMGLFVSDSYKALGSSDAKNAQWTADVKWEGAYGVEPNAAFGGTFTFSKAPNLDADYFVSVFSTPTDKDPTTTTPSACWSSEAGSAVSVTWDKKCSSSATVSPGAQPSGVNLYYQIKFVKKGTSSSFANKTDFFGQTKYVPFKF